MQRIMNIYGNRPGALQTYQTGDIQNAAKLGHSTAHDLQSLGINTDLAPDVDVPVVMSADQYMRTWGYTPQSVIDWGGTSAGSAGRWQDCLSQTLPASAPPQRMPIPACQLSNARSIKSTRPNWLHTSISCNRRTRLITLV